LRGLGGNGRGARLGILRQGGDSSLENLLGHTACCAGLEKRRRRRWRPMCWQLDLWRLTVYDIGAARRLSAVLAHSLALGCDLGLGK